MSSDFFILSEQNDSFSAYEDSSGFNGGSNINVLAQTIAPLYSDAATYDVGDYVMYNGELYVCTTAISTPETWTIGHWSQTDVVNSVESQIPVIDDTLSIAGDAADAKAVGDALGDLNPVKVYVPATFIQGSRNSAGTLDTSYKYRITTDDKFTVPKLISYPIPDGYQARVTSFNISTGVKIADESNVREFVTFRNDRSYVMTIRRITENTSEQADPDAMYNQVYRVVSSAKHLRIMIFGHSYSADSWQYVPFMLKNYGITCEIYLYYRGNGSIDQLVSQWENTSSTDVDAWGNTHPRRYCHIDSRYTDCWDDAYGLEGYSAKMVLETAAADGKIDLITLQTAPTEVYFVESVGGSDPRKGYEPYVRQAINLISASYNDSYALGWFCSYTRHLAYEGNVSEGYPAVSADTFDNKEDTLRAAETIYTAEPFDMVIPAAAAVFNARTNDDLASTNISLYGNLWFSDRVHLQSGIPCYVTNATVAQCLFDKFFPGLSVYGDQFRVPNDDWVTKRRCIMPSIHGSVLSTSEALYDLAQKCAIAACEHPFEITQILNPSDTEEITFSDPMSRYWELKASIGEATSALTTKMNNGVARDFSSASSYQKDDIVFYNGSLYRFTSSHSGAWTWADVTPEYNAFRNITRIDTKIENGIAPQFDSTETYSAGDAVYHGSTLCRFVKDHTGAWDLEDVEEEPPLTATVLNHTRNKADVILSSASGTIANFPDGMAAPAKNLTVNVEPVQDLHGYDNPWPAGGGVNKLPPYSSASENDVTLTVDSNGNITLNGTASGTCRFNLVLDTAIPSGSYYISFFNTAMPGVEFLLLNSGGTAISDIVLTNANYGSVLNASADIASLRIYIASGTALSNAKLSPMLVSGSSAPSAFSPYANICQITGWTGANVTRTGKNLGNFVDGYNVGTDGVVTTYSGRSATITPIKIESGKSYVYTSTTSGVVLIYAVWNGNRMVRRETGIPSGTTLNTSGGDRFVACIYKQDYSTSVSTDKPMIRFSTESNDYEPYRGVTIPITFPDSAGTVYGSTLDVTSGKLVVDKFLYVYDGTEPFSKSVTALNGFYNQISSSVPHANWPRMVNYGTISSITSEISSMFVVTRNVNYYKQNYGVCYLDSGMNFDAPPEVFGTTVDSFKAKLAELYQSGTPVSVFAKIATPIEYTLTASQLTTLLGMNNIWADTGDVSVDYRADTKLYIEQFTLPTEDDMVANANIINGKYFMVGNKLFFSRRAIAAGEKIIPIAYIGDPNANCMQRSIADALNDLIESPMA